MKKTFMTIALVAVMLFAMGMSALAVDFTDVKSNDWYTEDLSNAVSQGIIKGYEDGTFRPDEKVSRAEMVAMFNRALDIKYARPISYSDVVASEWYTDDVKKAQYAGIVTGYEDGTFRPGNSILRQEAGAIMGRIITKGDYEGYNELQSFIDYDTIGSWALNDLGLAFRKGYINGYPDGSFGPTKNLTRAEAITIVMRILDGENVVKTDVKFTSNGDALRGSIYTGSVTINSPTKNGSFEVNDCKVFAPMTFTSDYAYNKINLFTTTVCELIQKSEGLTVNMLGKTTIKELTVKNDTSVISSGEGNLIESANVEYTSSSTQSINSDVEDLVNLELSIATKELNVNGPTNFVHNGQTITTMNVNDVTDMFLNDGEITTLNMNAKAEDSNIEKNEGSVVNTLNSRASYFIYATPENAPLMHNVYETIVYVSHMPNEGNYSYKNPPTSQLVVKNTLNTPTNLNFTGSQTAFEENSKEPVYLNWTAPVKLPKQKISSYNIYYVK